MKFRALFENSSATPGVVDRDMVTQVTVSSVPCSVTPTLQTTQATYWLSCFGPSEVLSLILRRSRTGTVRFYTSTSNKRAARPKLYTKSLTRDLKLMYSRLTRVRISINL